MFLFYFDIVLTQQLTTVKCADGSVHEAGHVIVTVSLGVLKTQHSELFKPELSPQKQLAIQVSL